MNNAREVFSYYIISMIDEDLGAVFFLFSPPLKPL